MNSPRPKSIRKEVVSLTALTLLLVLPLFLWPYISNRWFPRPVLKPALSNNTAGVVFAIAFSTHGRLIATAGNGIQLYDRDTGIWLSSLKAGKATPLSVAFSPDGKTMASGHMDSTVRLWTVPTGRLIKILRGHTETPNVAYSPDGKYLASGSWSKNYKVGEIRLWDAATLKLKRKLQDQKSFVSDICFSPDSKTLITAGGDKTAKLWDVESGELKRTLRHDDSLLAIAISPDGRLIASGGWDKTVKLWDAQGGRLLRTWRFEDAEVRSIAFAPDSNSISIAASRKSIAIYDVRSGSLRHTFEGHKDLIFSTAYSPDGSLVASGSGDGLLKLWRVE